MNTRSLHGLSEPSTSAAPLRRKLLLPGPDQDPRLGTAPVCLVEMIDSTNEELARRIAGQPAVGGSAGCPPEHLEALLTEHQTQGRGRRDRHWSAPKHSAVLLSVAVRAEGRLPLDSLQWLTLLMALAASEAIQRCTGVRPGIKWPNDLLVGGRKLAGILARAVPDPRGGLSVVVGVGVNANLSADQLPVQTATSLSAEVGRPVDRTQLLIEIIASFRALVRAFEAVGGDAEAPLGGEDSLLTRLRARTETLGRRVRVLRGEGLADLWGLAEDLDVEGSLVLREDRIGRIAVSVGDVVHLRSVDDAAQPVPAGRGGDEL